MPRQHIEVCGKLETFWRADFVQVSQVEAAETSGPSDLLQQTVAARHERFHRSLCSPHMTQRVCPSVCPSVCLSSGGRRLLAPAEPRRVPGDGARRGLLRGGAELPRGPGSARHALRLPPGQDAAAEAQGDPRQGRENPPGPAAEAACPPPAQAARHHQGAQPAARETAAAEEEGGGGQGVRGRS